MSLDSDIANAEKAARLLQSPLLNEAFEDIKGKYTRALTRAKTAEDRERCALAIEILGKVRKHLETRVADGKLAARRIEEIENPKRWWQ